MAVSTPPVSVLLPFIDQEIESGFSPQRVVDAKSRLQQVTQARFESTPIYGLVDHTGPGHAPLFVIEVHAGPDVDRTRHRPLEARRPASRRPRRAPAARRDRGIRGALPEPT